MATQTEQHAERIAWREWRKVVAAIDTGPRFVKAVARMVTQLVHDEAYRRRIGRAAALDEPWPDADVLMGLLTSGLERGGDLEQLLKKNVQLGLVVVHHPERAAQLEALLAVPAEGPEGGEEAESAAEAVRVAGVKTSVLRSSSGGKASRKQPADRKKALRKKGPKRRSAEHQAAVALLKAMKKKDLKQKLAKKKSTKANGTATAGA